LRFIKAFHDPQNIVHVGLTGLRVEGQVMAALPEDKYKTIKRVAASDMSEDEFAQWIRKNLGAIKS
jgi:prophage maintenance system killer protein